MKNDITSASILGFYTDSQHGIGTVWQIEYSEGAIKYEIQYKRKLVMLDEMSEYITQNISKVL